MAEVTAMRNNCLPYPIYGAPYVVAFPVLDADGDLVTGATTPDSERSINGDTFADCTNEAVEIATASGMYYLILTAAEMSANIVSVIIKSATVGMKTTPIVLYPRKLVQIRTATTAGGAPGYITLDASASPVDDYYNGMVVVNTTVGGAVECRIIMDYTGSNKQATVTANWNTTPIATDTFGIYLPEGVQLQQANLTHIMGLLITGTAAQIVAAFTKFFDKASPTGTVNSLPDAVAGATGGVFIAGTNAATAITTGLTTTFTGNLTGSVASVAGAVNSVATTVNANLVGIIATALTETGAGYLAAAFKKFFDKVTPTGTINSLPDAVPGAAGGVFIAGANAATSIATALTANIIGNITGNLSGTVGSVTGAVGSVTGAVGSVTAVVSANLMQILGTALTETVPGYISLAFKKFFDVLNGTGTINSLPNAVAGAANGLFIAGTNAATAITTALTANIIGNMTGNLSGSVGSVTGAVGSVTGAVASVTGAVGSVTGNVGGNVVGSVASVTGAVGSVTGAVGSVTGNVGGNVVGSVASVTGAVGSVTGAVGSIAAGGIIAGSFAANALTASALATDAVNEIADGVWDEAIAGHLGAGSTGLALSGATAPTALAVADAVWDEAIAGHLGVGSTGLTLNGASAPTAAAVADAVWDEAAADHVAALTMGAKINAAGAAANPWGELLAANNVPLTMGAKMNSLASLGAGATAETITVDDGTNPIDGVEVWITTDIGGSNKVASGVTDAFGHLTFMLDPGTYYAWKQAAGFTFTNPETLVVT